MMNLKRAKRQRKKYLAKLHASSATRAAQYGLWKADAMEGAVEKIKNRGLSADPWTWLEAPP